MRPCRRAARRSSSRARSRVGISGAAWGWWGGWGGRGWPGRESQWPGDRAGVKERNRDRWRSPGDGAGRWATCLRAPSCPRGVRRPISPSATGRPQRHFGCGQGADGDPWTGVRHVDAGTEGLCGHARGHCGRGRLVAPRWLSPIRERMLSDLERCRGEPGRPALHGELRLGRLHGGLRTDLPGGQGDRRGRRRRLQIGHPTRLPPASPGASRRYIAIHGSHKMPQIRNVLGRCLRGVEISTFLVHARCPTRPPAYAFPDVFGRSLRSHGSR